MADFETVVTRKAFHFNDPTLSEFSLRRSLLNEVDEKINVYDSHLFVSEDDPSLNPDQYRILQAISGQYKKLFVVVEFALSDTGERECIIHNIPFGSWLVQMVDGSWEVTETPVIKDFI